MSVLDKILDEKQRHLAVCKARLPMSELRSRAQNAPPVRSLRDALVSHRFSVIGEIKRKSPTRPSGMDPKNVEKAPRVYRDSPIISAVSVLTDERFFGGSIDDLLRFREVVGKPILRKDFILDEYQVWEARAFGADAILLMAAIHKDPIKFRELFYLARKIGLDVLVEIGMDNDPNDPSVESSAIPQEAEIWGANSRKFRSSKFAFRTKLSRLFRADLTTSSKRHQELRSLIPDGKIAVAESGIHDPSDIDGLIELGYDAALIGTAFLNGPKDIKDVVESFSERISSLTEPAARKIASASGLLQPHHKYQTETFVSTR